MFTIGSIKERFYGEKYQSPFRRFTEEAKKLAEPDMVVFHAGCGADTTIEFRKIVRMTIGMDYDLWIAQNTDLDFALLGDLTFFPFKPESLDLIAARWVMEHLEFPLTFFKETYRTLKFGGRLIVMTPNLWNYATLITKYSPHSFQKWYVKNLLRKEPEEVYRVFYRANTKNRLRKYASQAGLKVEQIQLFEGAPNLLGFTSLTFLLGVFCERIVMRYEALTNFRGAIIATFSKV